LFDYDQFLANVNGAAVATRRKYLATSLRQFLLFAFSSGLPDWSALRAKTCNQFCTAGDRAS